jgi:DNA (cytosine-5)-methyltransferase 1
MKMKLLDLFCCGGGASKGYELAGFEVVGVDNQPQPKYRGTFIQADAIEYLIAHGHEYDVIHASPPCQKWSLASMQHRLKGKDYPDFISVTREYLIASGKPYVIENVPGAPLINPITLCGSMFSAANGGQLRTYRHRLFESNLPLTAPKCHHKWPNAKMGRPAKEWEFIHFVGHYTDAKIVREMLGLEWLSKKEIAQCVPPQYTEFIGRQILTLCRGISPNLLTSP